ncbi:MAG TPA: 5-(carboxyamino)imidazole ribonucleotide synthase [Gammaproteobacteria bacterium]|nr:5-(carboxyamino)imidazole ribonucleotide synthase [Gammaproteobacteria bacterium]
MTIMAKKLPLARLGVVGGGQLARMLAPACNNHDVQMTILDPYYNSPAGKVAFDQIEGELDDPAALQLLCERSDIVTFDLENVGTDILVALADQGIEIVPAPAVIRLIQNKFDQKCHYRDSGISTAEFTDFTEKSSFSDVEAFGLPCVQKTHTGGYDGRGVHIIRSIEDWENRLEPPSFIEKFIANGTELAVMVARRASGEIVAYDPVEMVVDPELNLLDYLIAPARVDANVLKLAQELAKKTVESFATPGLFGVELFLTNSGDLLVNEVAPRAHNSGHHTIEACVTSQFENQLRVCLDLPLGQTDLQGYALTANLVGEVGYNGRPVIEGLDEFAKIANSHIHLYGKDECRPGRKMGHFTLVGDDHNELIRRLASIRDVLIVRGDTPQ